MRRNYLKIHFKLVYGSLLNFLASSTTTSSLKSYVHEVKIQQALDLLPKEKKKIKGLNIKFNALQLFEYFHIPLFSSH